MPFSLSYYKRWNVSIQALFFMVFLIAVSSSAFAQSPEYMYSPSNEARLKNNRPVITFTLMGKTKDTTSVRLKVNGEDVTSLCVVTGMYISYKPTDALPMGKNTVDISFKSNDDAMLNYQWFFYVDDFEPIKSVEHNAKSELMEKETLEVTLKGLQGCKATFDIGDFKRNMPMKEVEPGVYKGMYEVKNNDRVSSAPVICKLVTDDGAFYRMKAKDTVSIEARFFKLKIISPANESYVSQNFKLRGRTKPNTIVKIATGIALNISGDSMSAPARPTGGITAEVDENGYFEEDLGFAIAMQGMKMVITAHAIDKKGNESMPISITVYLKSGTVEKTDDSKKGTEEK